MKLSLIITIGVMTTIQLVFSQAVPGGLRASRFVAIEGPGGHGGPGGGGGHGGPHGGGDGDPHGGHSHNGDHNHPDNPDNRHNNDNNSPDWPGNNHNHPNYKPVAKQDAKKWAENHHHNPTQPTSPNTPHSKDDDDDDYSRDYDDDDDDYSRSNDSLCGENMSDENEELCSKLKEEYCATPEELVTNSAICVYLGFEDDTSSGIDNMAME